MKSHTEYLWFNTENTEQEREERLGVALCPPSVFLCALRVKLSSATTEREKLNKIAEAVTRLGRSGIQIENPKLQPGALLLGRVRL